MARMLDTVYDSSVGKRALSIGRNMTVGYHTARFLMDLRWLGLEVIEAPTLVLFREGPGAMWEGLGKGKNAGKQPMFLGTDVSESMRTNYAWWLAQSDPGAMLRTRERYILSIVRRYQNQEYPRALGAYIRALEKVGGESADLATAIKAFDGGDTKAWLARLDTDWELAAKRGKTLGKGDAERLFKPWLDKGIISAKEYDEFLKANRYVGHPLIDAELARIADPRLEPLLDRLAAINEQGWNDAARLVFGQTDRSNAQRLANHPLLYWPISYQIKATKWLAGLLFDRSFGIDTGAGGAVTLGILHEQHKERMRTDPQYAEAMVSNPTLLFFAQMFFPIAPWDLGVGLSPFTRLAYAALTQEPGEGYQRNIFAVGPGYTYFNLLPRLLYEQSKEGSWAQGAGGIVGGLASGAQRFYPYSVPIAPKNPSEMAQVAQQTYGAEPLPPVPPYSVPENRYP